MAQCTTKSIYTHRSTIMEMPVTSAVHVLSRELAIGIIIERERECDGDSVHVYIHVSGG